MRSSPAERGRIHPISQIVDFPRRPQNDQPRDAAQEIHAYSRAVVAELLGADVAQYMRILYGGSCKPDNARELIGQPDIDGGLIGGASLKAADFVGIIDGAEANAG